MDLEQYFEPFRKNIIGNKQKFDTPFGERQILYADWVASARFYQPIEDQMMKYVLPYAANTHTESNITGTTMTRAYEASKQIIKDHVNASPADKLIYCGSGMTGAIAKLQRILGLQVPERFESYLEGTDLENPRRLVSKVKAAQAQKYHFKENHKPVVFVSHMEHHSNHTSWLETICDVEIINFNEDGLVCIDHFRELLDKYKDREFKIASITGCSNVTGIETPYYEISRMIHAVGGLCFVDFAASAPYCKIDMHPEDEDAYLDAIFFSPHKFLGGPGTPGILIFNEVLYKNKRPDNPGGGTVSFTSPWYMHDYIDDIEAREDGGTPPFIQGIRAALVVKLKEQMGVGNIKARKNELLTHFLDAMEEIPEVEVMAQHIRNRHGVVSFNVKNIHYNLVTKVLNDKYGIQVRGGCVCAGTYGHMLMNLDQKASKKIRNKILKGDNSFKPGFVRLSLHPTLTNKELDYIIDAIKDIVQNQQEFKNSYTYLMGKNEFEYTNGSDFDHDPSSVIFKLRNLTTENMVLDLLAQEY